MSFLHPFADRGVSFMNIHMCITKWRHLPMLSILLQRFSIDDGNVNDNFIKK